MVAVGLSDLEERGAEDVEKVKQTKESNCVLNHPTYSEALVIIIIYGVISFILFLMYLNITPYFKIKLV